MKNKKILISIILSCAIFVIVLLADLLTKGLIIPNLIPNVGDRVGIIPKVISFIYVKNFGAAWGIFGGRNIFLIVTSILILTLFLTFYILRLKKAKNNISSLLSVGVGLIAGGCIGNLFDRLVFGYVRDFINFDFINFPVFNFADIALTFGVIIMVVYFLFFFAKEDKNADKIQENLENNSENDQISGGEDNER